MPLDFTLTPEQEDIKGLAHEFAENEIRPVAAKYDETEEFPWPVLKKAVEIGLYGMEFYSEMVGGDPSGITLPMVMEEVTWGCAGIGLSIFGTGLPLSALASSGTPAQLCSRGPRLSATADALALAWCSVTDPHPS